VASCQFSVYPLGPQDIDAVLSDVCAELEATGLPYEVGTMSTLIEGEASEVFAALRRAFAAAANYGGTVLTATVSNSCPLRFPSTSQRVQ